MVIEKDPESGWLVGEVVELPGCYSQAPNIAGLEVNIQEAIKAYLNAGTWEEPLSSFVGTWQVGLRRDQALTPGAAVGLDGEKY